MASLRQLVCTAAPSTNQREKPQAARRSSTSDWFLGLPCAERLLCLMRQAKHSSTARPRTRLVLGRRPRPRRLAPPNLKLHVLQLDAHLPNDTGRQHLQLGW